MYSQSEYDKARYAERKSGGLCVACGNLMSNQGRSYCDSCRSKKLARYQRYRDNVLDRAKLNAHNDKLAAFNAYGGAVCVGTKQNKMCGENDPDCLTIDHVNNDGAVHREQHIVGHKLYRWLRIRGYPAGYQVMCFNCNMKKHLLHMRSAKCLS